MPNQTVKNSLKAKNIKLPQMIFFCQKTTNKMLMYLLASFILQFFQNIFRANPELWGCAIVEAKTAHSSWTNFFFGTNYYCYFDLPISPFHCSTLKKKSYRGSRVMRMHNFWIQNGPLAPQKTFFAKLLISF